MLKRLFGVLISIVIVLSASIVSYAASGDVDGDGYITAADARVALRIAANLEESNSAADIDSNGKITALDSRMALRMSAMIDNSALPIRTTLDFERTNSPVKLYAEFDGENDGDGYFCITISAENMTGLESVNLFIDYDCTKAEFSKFERLNNADMSIGEKISDGKIAVAMFYSVSADADSELCKLTFKEKNQGEFEIKISVGTWDGTEAPADIIVKQHVQGICSHSNTVLFDEEIIDYPESCYDTIFSAGTYCNDCKKWVDGHYEDEIVVHESVVHKTGEFEYFDNSCIMQGYTDGDYCELCEMWLSGHNETMKIVHIDTDENGSCDYCYANIEVSDQSAIEDEPSINPFNSIIVFFEKILAFIKQFFGL